VPTMAMERGEPDMEARRRFYANVNFNTGAAASVPPRPAVLRRSLRLLLIAAILLMPC